MSYNSRSKKNNHLQANRLVDLKKRCIHQRRLFIINLFSATPFFQSVKRRTLRQILLVISEEHWAPVKQKAVKDNQSVKNIPRGKFFLQSLLSGPILAQSWPTTTKQNKKKIWREIYHIELERSVTLVVVVERLGILPCTHLSSCTTTC